MLVYVLDALNRCEVERVVVVVGHGAERVTKTLQEQGAALILDFVEQRVQRGTGDAVSVGLTGLPVDLDGDDADVLVVPGDTPLLGSDTIAQLVAAHQQSEAACTMLTARVDDPTGYGRVVRKKDGLVHRIVEQNDATDLQLEIDEINTGIYCFRQGVLAPALRRVNPENAQGEYYLTDVVGVLHDAGYRIDAIVADDPAEIAGVNDRLQLAQAEAVMRARTNREWMRRGVTMIDPEHTYLDATVELANDVTIFPNTLLQGETVVGQGVEIGPDTRLTDCVVGADAIVEKTVGRDSEIGAGARVGPFVALEPGSHIEAGTRTTPFTTAKSSDDGTERA